MKSIRETYLKDSLILKVTKLSSYKNMTWKDMSL